LALLVGGFLWYQSRPKPPKPWNTEAIVVKDPPTFAPSSNYKSMEFLYFAENKTNVDYHIVNNSKIKIMVRYLDDSWTPPLTTEDQHLELPVFIPANQKSPLIFSLVVPGIPERTKSETDELYHERLRTYCEEHLGAIGKFVLFDEGNRYQINLPRWLAEAKEESVAGTK
jgi:hypothetical protein